MRTRYECKKCGRHYVEADVYTVQSAKRCEYWCEGCATKKKGMIYRPSEPDRAVHVPMPPHQQSETITRSSVPQQDMDKMLKGLPQSVKEQVKEILITRGLK